jgi:hypothetical protein
MAQCSYCKTRYPTVTADYPCGTRLMLLQETSKFKTAEDGLFFEFCESCGSNPQYARTNGETGELVTLAQHWENCLYESNPAKDMGCHMVPHPEE